jgi:hypothetical protein
MSRSRKIRLRLQPLESRETPAAMTYNAITDTFFGASGEVNLSINFTGLNAISWSTSPPTIPAVDASGTDAVANLKVSLTGTGINGNNVSINLNGQTLTGNVSINLSNRNDVVRIFNGNINGNVLITTGADNDQVILGGGNVPLVIGKDLKVNEGAGNDAIAFVAPLVNIVGNATIQMGAGANQYKLASPFSVGGNLLMQAGNGSDPINQLGVAGSSIGGNATFQPGTGQNSLMLPAGLTIGGNVSYTGGAGTDNVFNGATIGGMLKVSLGAGIDNYTYGASAAVGISANIKGGAPVIGLVGDVYNNFATITWPNTVTGFFP